MVVFRSGRGIQPQEHYYDNDITTTNRLSSIGSSFHSVVSTILIEATSSATTAHIDEDNMESFGLFNENISHQCGSCCSSFSYTSKDAKPDYYYYTPSTSQFCESHNDKPLWWLVLRWMKVMLLKIMRTYHAKPLVLIIAPLCMGLFIGFLLGRRSQQETHYLSFDQKVRSNSCFRCIFFLRSKISRFSEAMKHLLSWLLSAAKIIVGFFPTLQDTSAERLMPHDTCDVSSQCPIPANHKSIAESKSKKVYQTNADDAELKQREETVRTTLKSDVGSLRESGVPISKIPKHIAVVMDGNRRFGRSKYGDASRGHWDGSSKLVEFAKWCLAEQIAVLTVFAFSSENWNRDPTEVASLMQIFAKYCDELRIEAVQRDIKIVVLSTDQEKIPLHVRRSVERMVRETKHCKTMIMNICLSYGSRGEIVGATQSIVADVLQKKLDPTNINERTIDERLLTHNVGGDPDVLIRTSGEVRISNFLLWQLAYTELFFVEKPWPSLIKDDLLQVIRSYAEGRNRRFGK